MHGYKVKSASKTGYGINFPKQYSSLIAKFNRLNE